MRFKKKTFWTITILSILILFGSCVSTKEARRSKRAAKKLDKLAEKYQDVWGEVTVETVKIDTVIKEVTLSGEVKVRYDTLYLDSIINSIDTVNTESYKIITKYIQQAIQFDTLYIDTAGVHLTVYYDKGFGELNYGLVRDSLYIYKEKEVDKINPTVYKTDTKIPIWIWLIIAILTAIIVRLVIKM